MSSFSTVRWLFCQWHELVHSVLISQLFRNDYRYKYSCDRNLPAWTPECYASVDTPRIAAELLLANLRCLPPRQSHADGVKPTWEQTQPLPCPNFPPEGSNRPLRCLCNNEVNVMYFFPEPNFKLQPQWCPRTIGKLQIDIQQSLLILGCQLPSDRCFSNVTIFNSIITANRQLKS